MRKKTNNRLLWCTLLCIAAIILGIFLGTLYNDITKKSDWTLDQMKSSTTNTPSTSCIICKEINLYRNEDNLGIIFLNEGMAHHVEINRYDNFGKLIEKKDTSSQMYIDPSNGNDIGVRITTDSNRGYGTADLRLAEHPEIDMTKASENCCSDCLSLIQKEYYSVEPYDIVVVNYKTGQLKLLSSTLISFMLGDYYVSCKQQTSDKTDISEVDLLIFYCPERYE